MQLFALIALVVVFLCSLATIDAASYYWRADYILTDSIPVDVFNDHREDNPYSAANMQEFFYTHFTTDTESYVGVRFYHHTAYWTDRRTLTVIGVVRDGIDKIKDIMSDAGVQFVIDESNKAFPGEIKISNIRSRFGEHNDACANEAQDRQETDIDCGGDCAPCYFGKRCEKATDCSLNGKTPCVDGFCGRFNSSASLSIFAAVVLSLLAFIF